MLAVLSEFLVAHNLVPHNYTGGSAGVAMGLYSERTGALTFQALVPVVLIHKYIVYGAYMLENGTRAKAGRRASGRTFLGFPGWLLICGLRIRELSQMRVLGQQPSHGGIGRHGGRMQVGGAGFAGPLGLSLDLCSPGGSARQPPLADKNRTVASGPGRRGGKRRKCVVSTALYQARALRSENVNEEKRTRKEPKKKSKVRPRYKGLGASH